jgi:hypothetical protein
MQPLMFAYDEPHIMTPEQGGKQTQKRLFLLTDGCISNETEVVNFVKAKTDDHTKLFTCGIGEGAS